MAHYKYTGRLNQGQSVAGEMEKASADAVASSLIGRGVTPIKIIEVTITGSTMRKINSFLGADKVRDVELVMFCRQMYTITKSGMPLTRGIRGLAAGIRHEHFREVLNDVVDKLETGMALAQAMRLHPKVFNPLFVSMINVGESSGKLDEVFRQVGFYIDRDEETKKRIRSAMRYPSFVMLALIIAITTINILVVPAFADMFAQFNAELPVLTRFLIGMSNFFVNFWMGLLLFFVGSTIAAYQFLQTEKGALLWGEKKLKIPIVGGIIEKALMARYTRSFALMLRAAVPLAQCLNLCAAAIDNPWLGGKIRRIREGVERGESLLSTHIQAKLFTPLVLQMVSVGEESGQVEELLTEVAEFYEREVEYDLKTLTDRIEPILIIVMAVFVTVLALGIFMPMWNLYDVQST